jgi:hypothetical protein
MRNPGCEFRELRDGGWQPPCLQAGSLRSNISHFAFRISHCYTLSFHSSAQRCSTISGQSERA